MSENIIDSASCRFLRAIAIPSASVCMANMTLVIGTAPGVTIDNKIPFCNFPLPAFAC